MKISDYGETMKDLWIYIRAMFEEKYTKKENFFRCVKINDNKKGCICIPGVAVNYIANQVKFQTKMPLYSTTWEVEWNSECEAYFIKKDNNDWNMGIPDLQKDIDKNNKSIELFGEKNKFCPASPNGYTYIQIREFKNLDPKINMKNLYLNLKGDENSKIITRFFIILARDFRTEMDMNDYTNMLFRFSFFIYPHSGLNALEKNYNVGDDIAHQNHQDFDANVLTAYRKMVVDCKKINSDADKLGRLQTIGAFVGADISKLRKSFEELNEQEDVRGIDEFFQEYLNIAKKLERGGRLKAVMEKYKLSFS